MTVRELIKTMSNSKNKMLRTEQLQTVLGKEIAVKDYIGIKEKKALIDDIVNSCILYDDGVFKFNEIDKYIYFTMKTIAAYTNIELSDDIEEDYDLLCRAKLLDMIIQSFKKEYDDVSVLLQMQCEYVLNKNNLESQVGRFLNNISEKLDMLSNIMASKLDGFDFNNLPISGDDLEKLKKLISN